MATGLRGEEQMGRKLSGTTQKAQNHWTWRRGASESLRGGLGLRVQGRGQNLCSRGLWEIWSQSTSWCLSLNTPSWLSEGPLPPHMGQGHTWHIGRACIQEGSPSITRRKSPETPAGALAVFTAYKLHTITLHHHISMIPLHLLPKYHRIPVIVHIQCLTQTWYLWKELSIWTIECLESYPKLLSLRTPKIRFESFGNWIKMSTQLWTIV